MPGDIHCPNCTRTFADQNALYQHARFKHGKKVAKPPSKRSDEPSLAAITIEAAMKRAMGVPLDPLEESLLP